MKHKNHGHIANLTAAVLALFSVLVASVPALGMDDLVTHRETIHSGILQEERPVRVHLPLKYEQSESRYPVLFILDADQESHFQESVKLAESLADRGEIPRMIIIGIENTNRLRDMNLPTFEFQGKSIVGGADKFLKFIESELITFIDENYRTSPSRILFGRSASATFSIFAMVSHPRTFDAYIASSPSFFVNKKLIMAGTRKFFEKKEALDRIFFMNLGTQDNAKRIEQTRAYAELITQLAPAEFKWELRVMSGFGHVPPSSLEDGLEMIFGDTMELN